MAEEIARTLLQHLVDALGAGREVDEQTPLLATRIVDSTGILDLAQFIEEQWGIAVSDGELHPDNFGSIEKLAAFVQRKRGETA